MLVSETVVYSNDCGSTSASKSQARQLRGGGSVESSSSANDRAGRGL